jgi:hypothetical protein
MTSNLLGTFFLALICVNGLNATCTFTDAICQLLRLMMLGYNKTISIDQKRFINSGIFAAHYFLLNKNIYY